MLSGICRNTREPLGRRIISERVLSGYQASFFFFFLLTNGDAAPGTYRGPAIGGPARLFSSAADCGGFYRFKHLIETAILTLAAAASVWSLIHSQRHVKRASPRWRRKAQWIAIQATNYTSAVLLDWEKKA